MNTNTELYKVLEDMIEKKKYSQLRAQFDEMNAVDIAYFIETLPPKGATVAFRTLSKQVEMDVFSQLETSTQQHIIESITDNEIASFIDDLWVDDAVDMLEEMPASLVKRVLKNSSPETRAQINQFLRYPDRSAGSIMTAEFTDLRADMTVKDAIKRTRRIGENRETIYTCYVMDETRMLLGVVSVKDLLLAEDGALVQEIMDDDIIKVQTSEDKEKVTQIMAKYDLISLPVVDAESRLVGIVTVDDAVDIMQEEATEDFERMAAMAPSEKPYLKTKVFTLARNRLPWLMVLMISGVVAELILGHYDAVYASVPLLVSFIPMLAGTGGNAGSQSSTMVIRGMALGEITPRDFWKIWWKEARVGILVGVALAVVNFVRLWIMYPNDVLVALVVALTVVMAIFIAKTIGGILPIVAKMCKMDPALMAAPLITTIVDALTLIIYFNIAKIVFNI